MTPRLAGQAIASHIVMRPAMVQPIDLTREMEILANVLDVRPGRSGAASAARVIMAGKCGQLKGRETR